MHCQGAITLVLSAADDGESGIRDLRRRIDRAWPADEFDKLIDDAAVRLGIRVEPRKFRESRLAKWRNFIESLPDGDELEGQIIRIIERDLLDHAAHVLPIDGRDVMIALGLDPGPNVAKALRLARELWQLGVTNRDDLLKRVGVELSSTQPDK